MGTLRLRDLLMLPAVALNGSLLRRRHWEEEETPPDCGVRAPTIFVWLVTSGHHPHPMLGLLSPLEAA